MVERAEISRDDARWVSDLAGAGEARDHALADLRASLIAGLRRAFRNGKALEGALLEDVVQDTLVKILDKVDSFEGRSRFLTWAMAIAVHRGLSELRRRRWGDVSLDRVAEDSGIAPAEAADESIDAEHAADRRAVIEAMRGVIDRDLSPKQRAALLAMLGGMPMSEVARKLDSNRNAVYKLTFDARRRLREGLERAGYGAEDVRSIFDF